MKKFWKSHAPNNPTTLTYKELLKDKEKVAKNFPLIKSYRLQTLKQLILTTSQSYNVDALKLNTINKPTFWNHFLNTLKSSQYYLNEIVVEFIIKDKLGITSISYYDVNFQQLPQESQKSITISNQTLLEETIKQEFDELWDSYFGGECHISVEKYQSWIKSTQESLLNSKLIDYLKLEIVDKKNTKK